MLPPCGLRGGWGVGGTNIKKNMDAEPHSKQRRTTKRSKADESESEESSSAPELQNFPKFIIIIPTGSKTISDLSPFWIQKALQASIGTLTSVRKTQAGHLLIQTANAHYSRRLLALTDLAGVPVRAEPHRTLNSCKGVIRCSDLKSLTKDEIVDGLRSQGVTDCFHITVKSDNNNTDRRKTNTFILTFNTDTAPIHLNGPYMHLQKLRRLCMGVKRDPDLDVKITANIRAIS